MQKYLDEELAGLKEKLLTMGSYAESAVSQAVEAVVERNDDLAVQVQADDNIMDQYEIEIDDLSVHLLCKAPVATDLRLITVAMKISSNLERIGDEATTIARQAAELNQNPKPKVRLEIPRMAEIALSMLKDSLDSFVNKQAERARAIVPRDKEVDALHKQSRRELTAYMASNSSTIPACLSLLTVSKSLERVADHATNIAQEVVYLCEARDIRHEANAPKT